MSTGDPIWPPPQIITFPRAAWPVVSRSQMRQSTRLQPPALARRQVRPIAQRHRFHSVRRRPRHRLGSSRRIVTLSDANAGEGRARSRRYLKCVFGVHDVAGRALELRRGRVILSSVHDAPEAVPPTRPALIPLSMLLFRFYPVFGTFVSDMSTTHNRPPQPRLGTRSCGSRSRPLFDPGRERVDYLSDAGRADVRPARGRIDPAEVGLAGELCQ